MNDIMAKDLTSLFIDRGFNPVIGTIYQQQEYWLSHYRGEVDGFHNIQKKNIESTLISISKPSLQMAKKVAEDITGLLFNENVVLSVSEPNLQEGAESKAQDVLNKVLDDNNFYDEETNFIELTAGAYGTGVKVEYLANGKTKLNYLFGDRVVVIDYENTTIKAIAVIQQFQKNKRKYNHIMYHTHKDGKYRIQHEMYSTKAGRGLGQPSPLTVLFDEAELNKMRHTRKENNVVIVEYYVEYETDTPHFQVFKLAITNNYDVRSPMGIPATANSTDTLMSIDEKYYSSRMDSINSRKRIFVDQEATKMQKTVDASGNVLFRKYFDQDETQFQPLKGMGDSSKFVEAYAPVYDSAQHDLAIQFELNLLSSKTMLGRNYYSFENGNVGYMNELNVIASNSDTFRNRQKNINRLKIVLVNMMKSIMYLEKELGNYGGELNTLIYDVQFDDDIMTDDATKLAQLRKDVEDGYAPEYQYIMKAYGLSEEEALEQLNETTGINIQKIEALSKAVESGVISIYDAQVMLKQDLSEEELEISYIRTLVEKGIPLTEKQAALYNEEPE